MKIIEYSSNNSGGDWWLSDDDWKKLEKAGWVVEWKDFLGAKATSAQRHGLFMHDAVDEFEQITGQDADEIGCTCCGRPHYFFEVQA